MLSRLGRLNRCWQVAALIVALPWGFARAQESSPVYTQEELILLPGVEEVEPPNDEPGLADEIEALKERLEELEGSEEKRSAGEAEKKKVDAAKPSVKWTGELQADFYWFNQDAANKASYGDIENGEAFRRARFGMFGDYGPTFYRIEMDFAQAGRPTFLDVFLGIHDLPNGNHFRVGHFFEPFGLERQTSNRFVTFMERAMPEQAFAPARNTGVCINRNYDDENGTIAYGLFNTDSDAWGDSVGDTFNTAATGRITYLPWYLCDGREYLHLGAAYSFRGSKNDEARFRAQPEARLGAANPNVPFFVDTGLIPSDHFQIAGLESAWIHGSFSLQSEYMMCSVDADDGTDPFFNGWYAQASYFLTGEYRPYQRKLAILDRVIPNTNFIRYLGDPDDKRTCYGPGAWEVAVRLSQVDLNDDGWTGGRNTDFTAGLNWYLTPHLRFTSNYIHAMPRDQAGVDSEADIFAMRGQFEF
jgi:phosphate-selective porin OprO/OprP